MPTVAPPGPGDPAALGPYRLTGRLGEATYTAMSPSGERVVVKRFPATARPGPARLEALRRAAVVGAALVVGSGPDYVVTEHVDGPSLEEDVAAEGPRSGPALHRLAIATMTTVAALHRAGLRAGHVRPDRIVLGPDGPRLLCDGSAAPNPLLWSSPEEAAGDPVGPPADVFGWAATVVYAASGRAPFTEEERLAHGAANLDPLDGDLRQLVADCLAAEPGARPRAEEVLLRLIGHSGGLDTLIPEKIPEWIPEKLSEAAPAAEGAREAPTQPSGRTPTSRAGRSWLTLAAAGTAIALVCGGGAYALTPREARQPPATATTATTDAIGVTGAAPASPVSAASAASAVSTVSTVSAGASPGLTLHEEPADPVILTSYHAAADGRTDLAYARLPQGGFTAVGGDVVLAEVSPGGRWLAVLNSLYVAESERQSIAFTDRRTGERFTVTGLGSPYISSGPQWSRDGARLLLTVYDYGKGTDAVYPAGFLVADPATRRARFVQTANAEDAQAHLALPESARAVGYFRWMPDGAGVIGPYTTPEQALGTRVWDLSGRLLRSMHWTGPSVGAGDVFSPSGRLFATTGCEKRNAVCLWDAVTGERARTVPGHEGGGVLGWYDEEHLIVSEPAGEDRVRAVVTDFKGRGVRVLAEARKRPDKPVQFSFTPR
ncbi:MULTISPECIES: hypothetical protein [Microbispora]|uniref:hypothetical protein n=1 Tax=Microbispora TaxID=2005 RepID=UPI00143CBE00|nr:MULTISPECIES: hypothetical protein [unclassified Microbispora]NJP23647.1 hypothetical protein [Microbispora sp. CL1-1]